LVINTWEFPVRGVAEALVVLEVLVVVEGLVVVEELVVVERLVVVDWLAFVAELGATVPNEIGMVVVTVNGPPVLGRSIATP
jgi:hypothetical protein